MSFGSGFVAGALTVATIGIGAAVVKQLHEDGFFDDDFLSPVAVNSDGEVEDGENDAEETQETA